MKKFLNEYKVLRSKSETETLKGERVTVTTRHVSPEPTIPEQCPQSATHVGTIRTEEYKRDLAEFQARRSIGSKEQQQVTPVKKKCGRHSLPVSCTDCSVDRDNTFNYEKKSASKYKKKSHRRTRNAMSDEKVYEGLPNIQFLFQNQVFMPGNMATSTYSEPQKSKRRSRKSYYNRSPDADFLTQRHIDFKDEDHLDPPEFYKNSSLPFDVKNFLEGSKSYEEVDGSKVACSVKVSSHNSSNAQSKNDSGEENKLWEVMSELNNFDRWADEQLLQTRSTATKSEDSKSDTSAYGLPIVSTSNIDLNTDKSKVWNYGKWGVVPVQIKRLPGVSLDHVRKKRNTEINILRKCRHPNIILLMGLYPDIRDDINIVCERCVDSLYGILHIKGRILTAQMSVQYALDIANALVFLRMQGYIHSELCSESVMVTAHDSAKISDLSACQRLPKQKMGVGKGYEMYSPEPQYVNIEDSKQSKIGECEPLISQRSSEAYLATNAISKDYLDVKACKQYRWHAPELFRPDDEGFVHACSKTDVYSLALILWECCNAALPWKTLSYNKLEELYVLWNTGIRLPKDGTYPGCLLSLLQNSLKLERSERLDLVTMQDTLQNVKRNIDDLEYIVIPARISKKKSNFSSVWDTTSPTDSECLSPLQEIHHKAVIHKDRISTSDSSDKDCSKSDSNPLYEVINKSQGDATYAIPEKCFISDEDHVDRLLPKYEKIQEHYSSACSTPISKVKARIKDVGTPGALHRTDSTEYCSILSPNRTTFLGINGDKDLNEERPVTKLSRSFTPKSYKPLHIKVPEYNLESVKSIMKANIGTERSSYNFDIKNYSLPTTPIARSNKLRKNAWLSGDISMTRSSTEGLDKEKSNLEERDADESVTPVASVNTSIEHDHLPESDNYQNNNQCYPENDNYKNSNKFDPEVDNLKNNCQCNINDRSPDSVDTRDTFPGFKRVEAQHTSPETLESRERSGSWTFKANSEQTKYKMEDENLANVNVKPLVAIHERWIYEANRKTGRSMSLPEDSHKSVIAAVKPASHCVDTLQQSLPQLNIKKNSKCFRGPGSPNLNKNGGHWDQFCQARDMIAKSMNFSSRDADRHMWRRDSDKGTITEEQELESPKIDTKVDQATDTRSIEEFIRDLIRKEFHYLLQEASNDSLYNGSNEDVINRGIGNIMENLKNEEDPKKEPMTFSRVKINGNNKPLLQITFNRYGENSLQVLDNCVNVTICDSSTREKLNQSMEDVAADDVQMNSLKRCQAFSAIQEARSTEDLYIDDDLSTHMQENFGRVQLIPLHGSLHELLCERDECCLVKLRENGADTIYFRCDNSDTESRDALDGVPSQDTVVYKRSISLVEERIQRIVPKDKLKTVTRKKPDQPKVRPKSEVYLQKINTDTRAMSNSSPSLIMNDEVEVNIENVMSYQDSSSEECLKCLTDNDDFEQLEKKIEEDLANSTLSSTLGCLEKISEENLSLINEEVDKQ